MLHGGSLGELTCGVQDRSFHGNIPSEWSCVKLQVTYNANSNKPPQQLPKGWKSHQTSAVTRFILYFNK
eukprot:5350978-Amphidinium_carterae.1